MSDQACDIGETERDPSKDPITILKSICFVATVLKNNKKMKKVENIFQLPRKDIF